MTGAFYGGGHATKSALDVSYWCLNNVVTFYDRGDVFIPPKSTLETMAWPYQSLASAIQQAGVTDFPSVYNELLDILRINSLFIPIAEAANTRGALLLNKGTVSMSLGVDPLDGSRRIITEENYRLAQRFMDKDLNVLTTFEYGALIPGVYYNR